jgi:predicted RNA-binding protein YlxR (DUF448 family)
VQLIRLALGDSAPAAARRVIVDRRQRMPGRGAYLCRAASGEAALAQSCLELALSRNRIKRSLRAPAAELRLEDLDELAAPSAPSPRAGDDRPGNT